jgi:hypothetical protein
MNDMTEQPAAPAAPLDRGAVRALGRILYGEAKRTGMPDLPPFEEVKAEYRKAARGILRRLEGRGYTLAPSAPGVPEEAEG